MSSNSIKMALYKGIQQLTGEVEAKGYPQRDYASMEYYEQYCTQQVFEIKILLEEVLGVKYSEAVALNVSLTKEQEEKLSLLIEQRKKNEPLQYIVGTWDFYNETYEVGPGVLIPRQDTEILVEQTLGKLGAYFSYDTVHMLDLCSGSGCVAISVQKNTQVTNLKVTAVENSEDAFGFLLKNISRNKANVEPILGDLTEIYSGFADSEFHIITANPPYISQDEMEWLDETVQQEPREALLAEDNGLFFYKFICKNYKSKLKSGGYLLFEIGYDQAEEVSLILKNNGFEGIEVVKDYGGNNRVVIGRKK